MAAETLTCGFCDHRGGRGVLAGNELGTGVMPLICGIASRVSVNWWNDLSAFGWACGALPALIIC
jgi:hypothetical protein